MPQTTASASILSQRSGPCHNSPNACSLQLLTAHLDLTLLYSVSIKSVDDWTDAVSVLLILTMSGLQVNPSRVHTQTQLHMHTGI